MILHIFVIIEKRIKIVMYLNKEKIFELLIHVLIINFDDHLRILKSFLYFQQIKGQRQPTVINNDIFKDLECVNSCIFNQISVFELKCYHVLGSTISTCWAPSRDVKKIHHFFTTPYVQSFTRYMSRLLFKSKLRSAGEESDL